MVSLVLLIVFMVAVLTVGCGSTKLAEAPKAGRMKIAFIYNGPIGDYGWTYQHEVGRKYLQSKLSYVETKYLENVPVGADAERVLTDLAKEGNDVIITTSIDYQESVLKVAQNYPKVVFLNSTGNKTAANVGSFFGREYQGWYLLGVLAGKMTKSNILGAVGAFPYPVQYQNINAFTLGARSVNPQAQVRVVWVNTFYDPAAERNAAVNLIEAGADVVMQQTNSPAPQQAAEERKVYGIGINSDMSSFAPKAFLSGTVWNWGAYYVKAVEEIKNGTWKASAYWGGIDTEMFKLAPFGPAVPDDVRKLVDQRKDEMINGKLSVFAGPIKDQSGNTVVEAGKQMTDDDIQLMKFFVEGVVSATGAK